MDLTAGVSINAGDTVTRQTLYDLVALASIGTVDGSDMAAGTMPILSQSLPPDDAQLTPGLVWWDQTEQLMKVWTDMIDGTGCSVWLAFGPDRFDIAALATEPLPFGAAVQFANHLREVKLPLDPGSLSALGDSNGRLEHCKVIGFQNKTTLSGITAPTADSGTWVAVAVQGICWAWYPLYNPSTSYASIGTGVDSIISSVSGLTGHSGHSNVRGGLYYAGQSIIQTNGPGVVAYCPHKWGPLPNGDAWAKVIFTGPRYCMRTGSYP